MDLCDGDLAHLMRFRPNMREATAAKWFHQMAQALAYLHTIGIAHRDIKPVQTVAIVLN
jgi:serine/threonine protein kinase